MNRSLLDELAREHRWSQQAIAAALDLTGARPGNLAWRAFGARLLLGSGVGALGAGIVCFVAANWQRFGVVGRFAVLEVGLVVCAGMAVWRSPRHKEGQAALLLAILLVGALLALFGQSYQTGADLYELFFAWAGFALPFALAGRTAPIWALWWCVTNIALALSCGWLDPRHFVWVLLDQRGLGKPLLLLGACAVNLAAAGAFTAASRTRQAGTARLWLVRLLTVFAFAYGTFACILAVLGYGYPPHTSTQDNFVVAAFALACAVIAYVTLRARNDVFPLALIAGSFIAISTVFIARHVRIRDIGIVLLLALWVLGSSAAAGRLLMQWVRKWRIDERPASQGSM